jgi:Family of unknown function (DUF6498)
MMSGWGEAATALRILAAVLFAAFNLVPLYGIHAWNWDAFQLLLLYWAETAILFACTLVRLALLPPERRGTMLVNGKTIPASRGLVVGFFAAHGGMFVAGHLLFICVLFSGAWFSRLNGVSDFVHTFLIASGAWAALVLVVLAGTIDVLTGEFHPAFVDALAKWLHVALTKPPPAAGGDPVGSIVGGLYARIFIMQAAIIFGGMASLRYGTLAPLVIVIGLKTLIDLVVRLSTISRTSSMRPPTAA